MDEDSKSRWDDDKRLRKTTMAGLRAGSRAKELTNEIERQEWQERAKSYLEWMFRARASVLAALANEQIFLSDRGQWSQRLEEIDLTSSRAATDLGELLSDLQAKQRMWSISSGDIQPASPSRWPPVLPEPVLPEPPAPRESLNPVEMMLERQDAERRLEFQQRAGERERAYASVAAELGHLITLHRGYQSARSRS